MSGFYSRPTHFLWLLVFCTLGIAAGRPLELKAIKSSESAPCRFLSIRETQVHKRLLAALEKGQEHVLETTTEQIRVFSYDEFLLRDQAHSLCGRDEASWDFTVFDPLHIFRSRYQQQQQHVLASSYHDRFPPLLEIRPVVKSGSSKNRVDLVFFADGYTELEKSKFFADATRLANEISVNQTFYTVKPLLNIWAAFTPSVDSGIGTGGMPKDTPFGLYRDGTELRGVYYSKPDAARLACASMGDRCDYPILMGNDHFYGGLGGEFTVITPSVFNGALVLRHELGHSIIHIGEEYDGGDERGYFGCNAADTLENIGWSHWLTDPSNVKTSAESDPAVSSSRRVERTMMSLQQYPWTILNNTYSARFLSPGTYRSYVIQFSVSGIPTSDQLTVSLDDEDLGWKAQDGIGLDRYFYEFRGKEKFGDPFGLAGDYGLSGGEHEIEFVLNYPPAAGDVGGGPQLCSVEVLEYGGADEFNSTTGYYGIFPTFSEKNTTSYRPTNDDCLMRRVTSEDFCQVCIEGLWISLMSRIDLVDAAKHDCHLEFADDVGDGGRWKWRRSFEIRLLPLAQFRTNETLVDKKEAYEIIWSRTRDAIPPNLTVSSSEDQSAVWRQRGYSEQARYHLGVPRRVTDTKYQKQIFHQFTNATKLVLDEIEDDVRVGDIISVDVKFLTEEVRVDVDGYLSGGGDWVVEHVCGSKL